MVLIDNPNLQELFSINSTDLRDQRRLSISGGTVFAHLNPKLCPNKIDELKRYAWVKDWDEAAVSRHTNGDKEACNTIKLSVEYVHGTARMARIRFANFASQMEDPRSLLYYLISYRELVNGTTTMFEGRDGCSSQNDVWSTLEEAPIKSGLNTTEEFQTAIIPVKPATRYALYVKTYTISADVTGALSDMIYFETAPDTPGMPRKIEGAAKSNSSLTVRWLPPSRPNGHIKYYIFNISKVIEFDDIQSIDICDSVEVRDHVTEILSEDEPSRSSLLDVAAKSSSKAENSPTGCPKLGQVDDIIDSGKAAFKNKFQDAIIDVIYLRQPCTTTKKTIKKRSIGYDVDGSEGSPSRNRLTLKQHMGNSVQIGTRVESQPANKNQIEARLTTKEALTNRSHPVSIKFDQMHTKTSAYIPAASFVADSEDFLRIDLTGLEHFTRYAIEVIACHGEVLANQTRPSKTYNRCGFQAITQVRTLPIPENDRIARQSIEYHRANETIDTDLVTWSNPEKPNGQILAYRVRYKLTVSEHWTEVCINNTIYNRYGGFPMPDLVPGSYIFTVRAITLFTGNIVWSDELEFEILQDYLTSPAVLSVIIIFSLISIGLLAGTVTFYYQKRKHELIYASVNPDYVQYEPDEWEVDKSNVIIGSQIGTGAFGLVYKGQMVTEKGVLECAIKTVPPTATAKHRMDFLREASIMKQFDTFHVVKLMGVVSATTPVYVIMEYMENGDLKEFLRAQRETHQKEGKTLVDGIYLMVTQIADGMAYLASRKFVHRDLAARNCMVGQDRVVKIGDFGLTRDVYQNDYYRRDTTSVRLPVRWMAPECLKDNLYTTASDVWSFGIVVWEIVTFSAYPYQGLSNDEVIKKVVGGYTMGRPSNCPNKLFQIMHKCWKLHSNDRPPFETIIEYLLPDTEGKLYPNCFYKKPKTDQAGDSILASSIPEETNTGTESYPLLSWPTPRANGLTNGGNHITRDGTPNSDNTSDNNNQL